MKKYATENALVILSLLLLSLLFFIISFLSEGTYDLGDGIRHYLVSRYSWFHHDLLMYSWGKPFFTLISSVFSQFGLLGINFFNILCGVLSAFFTYKIAQHLNIKFAVITIPFLLFTPIYFPTLNSGLTEPFFSFILIFSIYLFLQKKFFWSCVIVSFLPFVRTEGFLILPLFFLILVIRKKYLPIFFLGFGTLIYSIAGYFYYNDFFWVLNQNPYDGTNIDIYGSGELLHFVKNYKDILGVTLSALFVLGVLWVLKTLIVATKEKTIFKEDLTEEIILIYGSFFIYFVAHSVMWWKGLANSLGLIRVLAGVVPPAIIICLRGIELVFLSIHMQTKKIIRNIILVIIVIIVVITPFTMYFFPYKLNVEEKVLKETADWYKQTNYTHHKIYYLAPYLAHLLNVDSFNSEKVGELWGLYPAIEQWGIDVIPDSTIVIWDAHFGPNECKIPLEKIMTDPNFQLLNSFKPEVAFQTLGGYNYEAHVFMKLPKQKEFKLLSEKIYDFEEDLDIYNVQTIDNTKAFSGGRSCKVTADVEYSATFKSRTIDIPSNTSLIKVSSSILTDKLNPLEALIVMSVDSEKNESIIWESRDIKYDTTIKDWQEVKTEFYLTKNHISESNTISIYYWNRSKEEFYFDDLTIQFWGQE